MRKTAIKPRKKRVKKIKSPRKKVVIRTPTVYHGGKGNMLPYILVEIPKHTSYIEPFAGGGAVFWAK